MAEVGAAANVIAIIDLSAKVASVIFQYYKEVRNAGDDIRRLRRAVSDLRDVSIRLRQLLDRPEGARLKASQLLINAVNDSQLQLQRLYDKLRPKTARQATSRLGRHALRWPFENKEVERAIQDLGRYTQTMNLALHVDQTDMLLSMEQKAVLARLEDQVAPGASFDSAAEQHNPRCLPNTRVEILQQISDWAGNSSAEAVFWLNGMAGTGKSTISRSVAESMEQDGRLGASFFFKRGETDRGTMAKFISTITADLVRRDPAVARHVQYAIENDPTIFRKAMREQFDKLIHQPLSTIQRKEPVVIVVDALDECDEDKSIKLMIHLFSQAKNLTSVQLKILLTSRPELPMRLGFKAIEGKYQDLILHTIPSFIVEGDISLFIENELAKIRGEYNDTVPDRRQLSGDWPGRSNILTLVQMAIPLFIFASTVCRFIADTRIGTPDAQLKKVLSPRPGHYLSKLGQTYLPILDNLIVDTSIEQQEEILEQFRRIVGSIIILASPLSTLALAEILAIPQEEIDGRLDMLHSVLSVPSSTDKPVRLLHLSFRDFLLKKAAENSFWVNETQAHRAMASNCLRMMGNGLRRDICQLKTPSILRSAVGAQKVNMCIPSELQYACLYWVYHSQGADSHDDDCERVYSFLKSHFLHWLEALSFMGRAWEILYLIKALQSLYKDQSNKPLSEFLEDAERFILANAYTIDDTPLQLYYSLLIFAPESSRVRTAFKDEIARWILLPPRVEMGWSPALQILEGHNNAVASVAFSPNGMLIASTSLDKTVRVWRAETGECIQIFNGHSDIVNSAAFSPNGILIASASSDNMVQVWRAETGEYIHTLKGHNNRVNSAAFSPNGVLIASASNDNTVRVWRTETGECIQMLKGHNNKVRSVAFSPDGILIASASDDKTVQVWRAETGECIQTLEGHSDIVTSAAFSPNGILIASASYNNTVQVWRAETGECIQTLNGHSDAVNSAAFSPDGTLIASASDDKTVRVWRAETGECIQILKGHNNAVASAAFSPDSTLIASASNDVTVRVWRAETGEHIQILKGHDNRVNSAAFSPNGTLIASASDDNTVRVWRAETGECIQTLKGHSNWVDSAAFSPNGILIASASGDDIVRVWRAETGECIQTLKGHSNAVNSAAFSPDGTLIASASSDNTVRVWRAETGEYIQILNGHSDAVNSAAFSPDGTLIASASDDNTVRVWRAETGECIQMLKGHNNRVRLVAFSLDGTLIASTSDNELVRVWRVETGEYVQSFFFGFRSALVSFDSDVKFLMTERGGIDMLTTNRDPSTRLAPSRVTVLHSGVGISKDSYWVTWDGENILLLPADFRPTCSAISGSTITIGSGSGRFIVMRFSSEELVKTFSK